MQRHCGLPSDTTGEVREVSDPATERARDLGVRESLDADVEDVSALTMFVLMRAYQAAAEDLRYYMARIRRRNKRKKAIRDYLQALFEFEERALGVAHGEGIPAERGDDRDRTALADLFEREAAPYEPDPHGSLLGVPNRVPRDGVSDFAELEQEIQKWEERLNGLGDDAQLANVDLQNVLQKQQQTLQMMSNIMKMLYDTAQSVIRKMGG